MQATRTPTISVFSDCSIPAGLRIGPVPGIFKLGKYVSDRKELGVKKKVSSIYFLDQSVKLFIITFASFFIYKMYLERNVKYFHFPLQMDKSIQYILNKTCNIYI